MDSIVNVGASRVAFSSSARVKSAMVITYDVGAYIVSNTFSWSNYFAAQDLGLSSSSKSQIIASR